MVIWLEHYFNLFNGRSVWKDGSQIVSHVVNCDNIHKKAKDWMLTSAFSCSIFNPFPRWNSPLEGSSSEARIESYLVRVSSRKEEDLDSLKAVQKTLSYWISALRHCSWSKHELCLLGDGGIYCGNSCLSLIVVISGALGFCRHFNFIPCLQVYANRTNIWIELLQEKVARLPKRRWMKPHRSRVFSRKEIHLGCLIQWITLTSTKRSARSSMRFRRAWSMPTGAENARVATMPWTVLGHAQAKLFARIAGGIALFAMFTGIAEAPARNKIRFNIWS